MKFFKNENVKIVTFITLLAIMSALLLGIVNILTKVDTAKELRDKISKNYSSPISCTLELKDFSYDYGAVYNVFLAENGAYILHSKSTKAYNNKGLELLVIISNNIIEKVVTFSSYETPGIGSKVLSKEYLDNFVGLDLTIIDNVSYKPIPPGSTGKAEISGVTGATKTTNGVFVAVNCAINYYLNFLIGVQNG